MFHEILSWLLFNFIRVIAIIIVFSIIFGPWLVADGEQEPAIWDVPHDDESWFNETLLNGDPTPWDDNHFL